VLAFVREECKFWLMRTICLTNEKKEIKELKKAKKISKKCINIKAQKPLQKNQ
jgi:hypothetical protein